MKKSSSKFKIIKYVLLICVVYFVASSFYNVMSQISENKEQIASLSKQISEAKKISKDLEDKKLRTDTDEHYKEVARETLGLVNPGDKVYINSNKTTSE